MAEVVARDDERWGKAIAALEGRFGDIVGGSPTSRTSCCFASSPSRVCSSRASARRFRVSGDELVDFVHLVERHKRVDNGAELTSETDAPV